MIALSRKQRISVLANLVLVCNNRDLNLQRLNEGFSPLKGKIYIMNQSLTAAY